MTRRHQVAVGAAVVAVVAVVAAAALLIRDDEAPLAGPTTSSTTSTAPTRVTAPLTGLPVPEAADLDHPAVAVKVSDVQHAHPQVGVDRADIVFVEPIGVSYTRLLAVFHTHLPQRVGPVRSVRPMDAPLLSPLVPVFANTMGAPWVVAYVDGNGNLDDLGTLTVSGSGAYVVDPAREAPDHVFVRPRALMGLSDLTAPPEPYFSYAATAASASAAASSSAGASVTVQYGQGWDVRWTYDAAAHRYVRSEPWGPHTMADGTRIRATNVLVLKVPSHIGKIGTASGAPVPILSLEDGHGSFVALARGHAVTGTWSKGALTDPFVLTTDAGQPLELSPGTTWVELPAPSGTVATG
jgi:hypothetical protein